MEEFERINKNWDICKKQLEIFKPEILNALDMSQIVDMLFEQNTINCVQMMECVMERTEESKLDLVLGMMTDMDASHLQKCLQCIKHCAPGVYSLVTNGKSFLSF